MTEGLMVTVAPMVRVVQGSGEPQEFPAADVLRDGDDLSMIGDVELLARVEDHLDATEGALRKMRVTRPETGNILISEEPVYG